MTRRLNAALKVLRPFVNGMVTLSRAEQMANLTFLHDYFVLQPQRNQQRIWEAERAERRKRTRQFFATANADTEK